MFIVSRTVVDDEDDDDEEGVVDVDDDDDDDDDELGEEDDDDGDDDDEDDEEEVGLDYLQKSDIEVSLPSYLVEIMTLCCSSRVKSIINLSVFVTIGDYAVSKGIPTGFFFFFF